MRLSPILALAVVFVGCTAEEKRKAKPVRVAKTQAKAKPNSITMKGQVTVREEAKAEPKPADSTRARSFHDPDEARIQQLLARLGKDKARSSKSSRGRGSDKHRGRNLEQELQSLDEKELGERIDEVWAELEGAFESGEFGDMSQDALLVGQESLARFEQEMRTILWQLSRIRKEGLAELHRAQRLSGGQLEAEIKNDRRARGRVTSADIQHYQNLREQLEREHAAQEKEFDETYKTHRDEIYGYRKQAGIWSRQVALALRAIEEGQRRRTKEPEPDAVDEDPEALEDVDGGEALAELPGVNAKQRNVYERSRPSILKVHVWTRGGDSGIGSAFVIDNRGHLITNQHVVGKARKVRVKTSSKVSFPAKIVATDKKADLALLKVEGLPVAKYPPLLISRQVPRLGEEVFTIGHPVNLEWTLTVGRVSAHRKMHLQMQTPVNPGNSGGPLMNQEGKVVGVVVGGYRSTKGKGQVELEGLNLAIRIRVLRTFLKKHLKN